MPRTEQADYHMANPPDVTRWGRQDHKPAPADMVLGGPPRRCKADSPFMRDLSEGQVRRAESSERADPDVCWTTLAEGGGGSGRAHARDPSWKQMDFSNHGPFFTIAGRHPHTRRHSPRRRSHPRPTGILLPGIARAAPHRPGSPVRESTDGRTLYPVEGGQDPHNTIPPAV